MCAEDLPQLLVAALAEQVEVHFAQGGQEAVAVGDGDGVPARIGDLEPVVDEVGERQRHREHTGVDMRHRVALAAHQRHHFLGMRLERTDHCVVVVFVRAEDAVRAVVRTRDQPAQLAGVGRQVRAGEFLGSRHCQGSFVVPVTPGAADLLSAPAVPTACSGCARRLGPAPAAHSSTAPTGIPPR